jgi:hypothetical protein
MSGLIIFDFSFPGILKEEIGTVYIGQDSF